MTVQIERTAGKRDGAEIRAELDLNTIVGKLLDQSILQRSFSGGQQGAAFIGEAAIHAITTATGGAAFHGKASTCINKHAGSATADGAAFHGKGSTAGNIHADFVTADGAAARERQGSRNKYRFIFTACDGAAVQVEDDIGAF